MNAGFGGTLRQQRAAMALSQERVGELAGLPPARVAAIEAGAPPSTTEVWRLGSALAVDPAALWRGEISEARTTARFRAPFGVKSLDAEDARLLACGAEVGRIAAHMAKLLGHGPSPVAEARRALPIDGSLEPWDHGYRLGAKARQILSPDRKPLPSMLGLLESCGVHVAFVRLQLPDVLAVSLYEPKAAPVILVNSHDSAQRSAARLSRRAILAHELCHLLHDGGERDLTTIVSRTKDHDPVEQRANGFAPSFVVPGGWIVPHTADEHQLVIDVATEWGLSFEGAVWHLKNSGKISNAAAEELAKRWREIPEGSFEPVPMPVSTAALSIDSPSPLTAGLLARLVVEAYEAGLISRGRAREILQLA